LEAIMRRAGPVLFFWPSPTPAMLGQLHQLINDPAAAGKAKARADAVNRLLDHIQAQFIWCSDHPTDKDCGGEDGDRTVRRQSVCDRASKGALVPGGECP
jgi:hypothetical protein